MEFETLDEAVASAKRLANLLKQERYVLKGSGPKPFWTCGPTAKQELWPMMVPVRVVNPGA